MDIEFGNLLRPKLDAFIKQLQESPKYSAIVVDYTITDNNEGLKISSNSGMWLCNSMMLHKELSDFIYGHCKDICKSPNITIDMCFSQKDSKNNTAITPDCKVPQNSTPNSINGMEQAMFYSEKPKFQLEDVILQEETLNSINDAIATIESFEMVYKKWNFISKEPSAKTIICFYGAPGTGKTMCAHAIANRLGKNILIASYADIQSQYVGVGPKNLRAVFQEAERSNAVLFFDEADSFLRKRTSDNSSSASMHYNSMTNEMMKHLEDFNGIVIFATNLTENTDEAFKTRISFSIEFKEPDDECRAKIIQKMIPAEVPLLKSFSNEDYLELSHCCEGLVGRDIRNAVKTILSVGAHKSAYPFTKEQFQEGFAKYKSDKKNFDKNSKQQSGANPVDIYTANGCIYNLLTYAAWFDGKENDIETEYLKIFAKILNRSRQVINSISDLPDFEEICYELHDDSVKRKTLLYLSFFMAITQQTDDLFYDLVKKVSSQLKIENDFVDKISNYYLQVKRVSEMKKELL